MIVNLNEKEYRVLKRVLREAFFKKKAAKLSDKELLALSAEFKNYVETEQPDLYDADSVKGAIEDFLRDKGLESLIGTEAETKIILSLLSMI